MRGAPRALPRRRRRDAGCRRRRRSGSGSRSRASPASASPRRTRPPSACSPTSRPGCGSTTRRSSSARCSTSSRWASTRPTPWSTRRSAAASRLAGPDANRSRVLCHVETPRRGATGLKQDVYRPEIGPSAAELRGGLGVRIGLGYVKGVRKEEMESLVAERERGGALPGDRRPRLALGGGSRRPRAPRLGRRPRRAGEGVPV